jgi:hypothetical protein
MIKTRSHHTDPADSRKIEASDNTVYLSRADGELPTDRWGAAVVGVFDLVDGYFAFDHSGVGAVGAGGEQFGEDLVGDDVAGVGEGVREKNPGGWRWFAVRPGGIW